MRRASLVAIVLLACAALHAQQLGVLRVKVTVAEADGQPHPIPRHALLISDNPATAAPQRVVTSADGTASIRLRPGNYTIESDAPLVLHGKTYEWNRTLDVPAGRDTLVEFTTENAEIGAASAAPAGAIADAVESSLLVDWQDSVFRLWTPTRRGSGFLADSRGLILTNQRLIGDATEVEVQVSPSVKVTGRVLVSDGKGNVALVWVDPKVVAALRPIPLGVAAANERVFAIDAPYYDRKSLSDGVVSRVSGQAVVSNVSLDPLSAGVPLQNANGEAVAITTPGGSESDPRDVASASVAISAARAAIASAKPRVRNGSPPPGTSLPIESDRPFDEDALRDLVKGRGGNLAPYHVAAADFDVYLITPVHLYAEDHRPDRTGTRRNQPSPAQVEAMRDPVREFENWTDYVSDYPPVVLIRVVPKMVESFWTTVARGAAQTQGVSIPAIKHLKTSLRSLRLQCGAATVTPIHALTIQRRMPGDRTIGEALHVFDPGAIGPQCSAVTITLVSEKAPGKADTRVIDAKILQHIQDDFAPWRAAGR